MNNYHDLAEIRGTSIPMFNQHGTALSQEEREAIAKKKGVCVKCGLKTHDVKMFKRTALTTDHVYDGKCIRCNSNTVPLPILQAWEQKFKPIQAPASSAPNAKFRMAGRLAALSIQAGSPAHANGHQVTQNRLPSKGSATLQIQRNKSPTRSFDESQRPSSMAGEYTHTQKLRPRSQQASLGTSNGASDMGNLSQHSVTPPPPPAPSVSVGSDVMINEDYTGCKSKEESWQLLGVLRDNKGQPDLLRPRLHRLRNIGNDQAEVLYEIKEVMEIYMNDARMMTVCCGALWGVTARSDSLNGEAYESGAVDTMLDALNNPASQRDADFVQWALGAISCLARGTESRRAIADGGGIELILESMKRLPASAGVFEWSCRALHSLVTECDGNKRESDSLAIKRNIESLSDGEGIAVIVSSMTVHAGETVAQLWATKLLWKLLDRGDNISQSNKVTERIVKVGGVGACSKILKNRSTSCLVYEGTAVLLRRLLLFAGSEGIEQAADCMVATIRKMSENPDEIKLQEACCNLLAILMPANRLQFKESEGLKAIVTTMASAVDNVALQRAASKVVWSASYIPAFFDFSYLKDALEAVDVAQASHPDDIELLISVCGFIANVATYTSVTSSGIPFEIPVHALGLNDDNVQLHDQAGRALGNIGIQFPHLMKKIIDTNGLRLFVDCLDSSSPRAVQSMCGALTTLANSSDEYKIQIVSAGCMDVAKRQIQRSVSFAVTEKVLELLSTLASSTNRSAMALPGDIFQVIMHAMRTHMSSAHDLLVACNAIDNLLVVSIPGSNNIDFSGLVEYMTDMINTRSLSVDLKRSACGVLWALCARQTTQTSHDLDTMFRSVLGVMMLYKGDELPYNSQLQAAASGALASITACMRDQNTHIAVEDVEALIGVTYMVMEFDSDKILVLEQFLDVLLNLSFVEEALVIQCGGIVVVIDAMVEHEADEPVQELGCAILALLSSTENLQVNICIAETDGIDMIVSALAIFSANQRIQVDACKALSHLSVDHESRMLIASQGGMILIVNSMNSNSDNLNLLEGACSALLNLSSDAEEQIIADSNVVETVVKTMRHNPDAMGLQEKALGVLQNLSMRNAASKQAIAQAGGINAVTAAIKEFMGSPAVLERAFSTMWSLAVLERNQVEIANAEGIELVVNGMMANINYAKVQKQACGCLCTLASNSRNKTLIREAGGVDAILFAMWAHYDSEVLQIEACRALSSLAVNVQTNEVMIATDGEINAIISAMRLFPESPKLQEHACVAMRNFMLSADNADLIRTNAEELGRLMKHAATKFPDKCSDRANQVLASL
ncbi:hypothetical protein MHU86_17223 [Fragilaria crotonensis]|nr:hypothetical protein MHU86_17223 [Fragilaria crotonensis]